MPRTGNKTSPRECDGSGLLEICETKVPHRHCECGLPMERSVLKCKLCVLEESGVRIHNVEGLIRQSLERVNHDAPEEVHRSPFKTPEGIYQFGDWTNQRDTSRKSFGKDWLKKKPEDAG